MGEIFLKLLNMSITAGWLIMVVLGIRLLFRKIPKWITCLLWGVVARRLIFPFSIESEFSLQPSASPIKSGTVVEGEVVAYVPSIDSNLESVENTVNLILAETFAYQETGSVAPLQVFTEIVWSVWLCGMAAFLLFAAASMIRLRLGVREAVLYKDNIYICDAVKSPFILGVIKPRIYLSSVLNEEEMDCIIAHEKAHLRRKDNLWKPFGYLLLCVYWFNPLCWIAYVMLCKDIELACDEKVIKDMSFGDKKEYSRVLLSCASQRRLVLVCPLAFGEVGVKERVKSVLNYKKPAFGITILAMMGCIIVSICFLTNPRKEYSIRITIPAGSTEKIACQEDFFCSDENSNESVEDEQEQYPENVVKSEAENSVAETAMMDTSKVSGIVVINGNTGEQITLTAEDSAYKDLIKLYCQLDFSTEYEENTRVGYRYSMKLLDADGNTLQRVTPYKDGYSLNDVFIKFVEPENDLYDNAGVRLLNYVDLLFYPAA